VSRNYDAALDGTVVAMIVYEAGSRTNGTREESVHSLVEDLMSTHPAVVYR